MGGQGRWLLLISADEECKAARHPVILSSQELIAGAQLSHSGEMTWALFRFILNNQCKSFLLWAQNQQFIGPCKSMGWNNPQPLRIPGPWRACLLRSGDQCPGSHGALFHVVTPSCIFFRLHLSVFSPHLQGSARLQKGLYNWNARWNFYHSKLHPCNLPILSYVLIKLYTPAHLLMSFNLQR